MYTYNNNNNTIGDGSTTGKKEKLLLDFGRVVLTRVYAHLV